MSSFKDLPPGATAREQFQQLMLRKLYTESTILRRAGADKKKLETFRQEAEKTGSLNVFNHLADYAESIMPELVANRKNWPSTYKKSIFVTNTPNMLRLHARTLLRDARDEYQEKPPTQRQERLKKAVQRNRDLVAARNAPEPRRLWVIAHLPEAQLTPLEVTIKTRYLHNPQEFEKKPELVVALHLLNAFEVEPIDWDRYYQSTNGQRGRMILNRLKEAAKTATRFERELISQTKQDLIKYDLSSKMKRSQGPE